MQKPTLIILTLALSLSLSACGKKEAPAAVSQGSPVEEQKSLIEWLKGGEGTECVIQTPEGEMVIKSQDGQTRIEGMPVMLPPDAGSLEEQTGVAIYKGDWIYMWSGNIGTKMNQKRMEAIAAEMGEEMPMEEEQAEDWTDVVAGMEEMEVAYDCSAKTFAASEFSEPSGVEFTDLTAQFEQMAEMTKTMQESMNSGNFDPGNLPAPPELPDMEALMDDMQ